MKKNTEDIVNYNKAKANLDKAHASVLKKIQTKRAYIIDNAIIADFSVGDRIKVVKEIEMEDLTTDEQHNIGVNIFKLKVLDDISMSEHTHVDYTQLLYVIKGAIYEKLSKVRVEAGDTLYISKRNKHAIKYLKDSELLMIFIPSLKVKTTNND